MTLFRQARPAATLRLVWKTLSGSHGERSGGGAILLPAFSFTVADMIPTLHDGGHVGDGCAF